METSGKEITSVGIKREIKKGILAAGYSITGFIEASWNSRERLQARYDALVAAVRDYENKANTNKDRVQAVVKAYNELNKGNVDAETLKSTKPLSTQFVLALLATDYAKIKECLEAMDKKRKATL
jgi:hypothetical protein